MDFATSTAYLGLAPSQGHQPAAHVGLWPGTFAEVPVIPPLVEPNPLFTIVPYSPPRRARREEPDRKLQLALARDDDEALLLHLLRGPR